MSEMCSVCIVRAQRDDDDFLPCSPACFRAALSACEQRVLEQNSRAFEVAVIRHLMQEERAAALDEIWQAVKDLPYFHMLNRDDGVGGTHVNNTPSKLEPLISQDSVFDAIDALRRVDNE